MAGIEELNAEIANLGAAVEQDETLEEAQLKAAQEDLVRERESHQADLVARDAIEAELNRRLATGLDTQPQINALRVIMARITNSEPTAVAQPVATEPVATEPVATEPVATEPVVTPVVDVVPSDVVTSDVVTSDTPVIPVASINEPAALAPAEAAPVSEDSRDTTTSDNVPSGY